MTTWGVHINPFLLHHISNKAIQTIRTKVKIAITFGSLFSFLSVRHGVPNILFQDPNHGTYIRWYLRTGPHVRSNYLLINLFIVTGSRIRIRISKKVESEFKIALKALELIEISHESIFSSLSENSFFSFMRAQHIDNSCCWSAIYEKKLCQISHVLS